VAGTSTTTNDGGATQMDMDNGGSAEVSADGQTMTITNGDGTQATAAPRADGVVVIIDGVEFVFPYNAQVGG